MTVRKALAALVLGCGIALAGSPALSVSFGYDFTGSDFMSSDFTLVGDALWASDGHPIFNPFPNRLRLTSAGGNLRGNAWLGAFEVGADQPWTAEFTWQITFEGGGGADGMAFHLHENGDGADTFFWGAGLSDPRLSVAIDTWNNGGGFDNFDFALEVHNNGVQVGEFSLAGIGGVADNVYQVVMSYDGAGTLTVNVINTNTPEPHTQTGNLSFGVDLTGLDAATLGWSAQTGGAAENHDIRTFSATFVTPEPGTSLLLGIGLLGLARVGRRRA